MNNDVTIGVRLQAAMKLNSMLEFHSAYFLALMFAIIYSAIIYVYDSSNDLEFRSIFNYLIYVVSLLNYTSSNDIFQN